jgi:site-specific DNA-methyltransferase (adenine-specific)
MEYLIRTYTNAGDTVLDFAMGSGTTGVACVNLGREFIGIEKDAEHYKTACDRIAAAKESSESPCPAAAGCDNERMD